MSISVVRVEPLASEVDVTGDMLCVRLADGRGIGVPIAWFPRLLGATSEQRRNWQLVGNSMGETASASTGPTLTKTSP